MTAKQQWQKESRKAKADRLEVSFARLWNGVVLDLQQSVPLVREYKFSLTRKWKFDFAHVGKLVAIEIEGGHWSGGRHVRGKGFENDCEKYLEATLAGWTVVRLTSNQINTPTLDRIARFILHL